MKLKLVEKRDEAVGTKSFFWQPETPVAWKPGQYYYFTTMQMKYPDTRGNTRHFTISSSPTEGAIIRFTTRMRDSSGFKKTIDELPIGAEIDGEGPNGTFILDENSINPNIFVAGGIGITPFRAMIKNVVDKKLSTPIYLIYSNSTPEDMAFKDELAGWTSLHPTFKMAMTISHPELSKDKWNGHVGRIDDLLITEMLKGWQLELGKCTFWVCGPPTMNDAIEGVLGKLGVTADNIRSEKFTGY